MKGVEYYGDLMLAHVFEGFLCAMGEHSGTGAVDLVGTGEAAPVLRAPMEGEG